MGECRWTWPSSWAKVLTAWASSRASAYRRERQTLGEPATDGGDYLDHIRAVADAVHNLPGMLTVRRSKRLPELLAALASGDHAQARWVRSFLDDAGYTVTLTRHRQGNERCDGRRRPIAQLRDLGSCPVGYPMGQTSHQSDREIPDLSVPRPTVLRQAHVS